MSNKWHCFYSEGHDIQNYTASIRNTWIPIFLLFYKRFSLIVLDRAKRRDVLLRACPKKSQNYMLTRKMTLLATNVISTVWEISQNNLKEISQSQSFFEMTNALSGLHYRGILGQLLYHCLISNSFLVCTG